MPKVTFVAFVMLFFFALVFSIAKSQAGVGVVTSYQAYVYSKATHDKKYLIKILKRGKRVTIHNLYLVNRYEWYRKMKNLDYYQETLGLNSFHNVAVSRDKLLKQAEFVKVVDDQGVIGYMPSKFLEIYYEDYREKDFKIPSIQDDPTDSRDHSDPESKKWYLFSIESGYMQSPHYNYFQIFLAYKIVPQLKVHLGPLVGYVNNSMILGVSGYWEFFTYSAYLLHFGLNVRPYLFLPQYSYISAGIDYTLGLRWQNYYSKIGAQYSLDSGLSAVGSLGVCLFF